jgi:hypothetical protein
MAASTLRQRSVMGNCVFSINSLGFAVQDAATSAVRFSFLRGEAGGTRMAAGDGMDPHPPKVMAEWSGSAGLARAQSPILTSLSQAVSPVVEQNEIRSQGPSSKHFLRADK